MARAEIGVFGGSGFYSFLEDVEQVEVETPYGKPSAPFTIGDIGGKSVAFLPRHGLNHELPPHAIPFRANVWAMKELGVRRIIGPNASGALKAELELGESLIMLADEFPEMGIRGPKAVGGTPVMISVYVEDVDAVFDAAVAAGATAVRPVENQFYGDRSGTLTDPFGHVWTLATHIEDVSAEEMGRRAATMSQG